METRLSKRQSVKEQLSKFEYKDRREALASMNPIESENVNVDDVFGEIGDIEAKLTSPDSKVLFNAMSRMFLQLRTEVTSNIQAQDKKIQEIETRVRKVEEKAVMQGNTVTKLNARVQTLERNYESMALYNNKENLVLGSVPEHKDKTDKAQVREIFSDIMKIEVEPEHVYRRGKQTSVNNTRPLVVRMKNLVDKGKVLANVRALKGTPITINEDLPVGMLSEQRKLLPILRTAKKYDNKAKVTRGRLIYKGLSYNVSQAYTLPFIAEASERRSNERIYFYGRYSMLSNFYPSAFLKSGIQFPTVEHYFQFMKATYHDKSDIATEILLTQDPSVAKSLGDKVKTNGDWQKDFSMDTMREALKSKFNIPKFKDYLVKTKGHLLVEASKYDTHWGIGTSLYEAIDKNPHISSDNNKLGQCLMDIREALMK